MANGQRKIFWQMCKEKYNDSLGKLQIGKNVKNNRYKNQM